MKRLIILSAALLLSCVSFYGRSQCTVSIIPQGATTFCEGDSVVLIASGSGASSGLDQSQAVYNGGTSALNLPGYSYWQSFEAGVTGILSQIDIGFFTYINGTGYFTLWDGSGTAGLMLDSQVVIISCGGGNCLLSFMVNIPVIAGETYTFQIRGGPGMPNPYGIQIGASNPYTNGEMGFVDPSGTYLTDFDMVFNTYVGQSGITYEWSTGETDSAITVNTEGTYTVTATDLSGCISTASQDVEVNPLPEVNIALGNDTLCVSDMAMKLYGTPVGGEFSGENVSNDVFAPSVPGVFTIYYTYTDSNGCMNSDSAEIVVEVCTGNLTINNSSGISVINGFSANQFIVKLNNVGTGINFALFNFLGEKILSEQLQEEETIFNMNENSSGIYLYVLSNGNRAIATGKIMIGK